MCFHFAQQRQNALMSMTDVRWIFLMLVYISPESDFIKVKNKRPWNLIQTFPKIQCNHEIYWGVGGRLMDNSSSAIFITDPMVLHVFHYAKSVQMSWSFSKNLLRHNKRCFVKSKFWIGFILSIGDDWYDHNILCVSGFNCKK